MQEVAPAPQSTPERAWYFGIGIVLCLMLMTFTVTAQERVIRVARVSLVEGEVNFQRSQDK